MEIYSNDEQQVEALQRFLKENGLAIFAGLVIGLGGLYGFRQYQEHQLEQLEAQSTAYNQLLEDVQKPDSDKEAWLVSAKKFVDEKLLCGRIGVMVSQRSCAEKRFRNG